MYTHKHIAFTFTQKLQEQLSFQPVEDDDMFEAMSQGLHIVRDSCFFDCQLLRWCVAHIIS